MMSRSISLLKQDLRANGLLLSSCVGEQSSPLKSGQINEFKRYAVADDFSK